MAELEWHLGASLLEWTVTFGDSRSMAGHWNGMKSDRYLGKIWISLENGLLTPPDPGFSIRNVIPLSRSWTCSSILALALLSAGHWSFVSDLGLVNDEA